MGHGCMPFPWWRTGVCAYSLWCGVRVLAGGLGVWRGVMPGLRVLADGGGCVALACMVLGVRAWRRSACARLGAEYRLLLCLVGVGCSPGLVDWRCLWLGVGDGQGVLRWRYLAACREEAMVELWRSLCWAASE